MAEQNLIANTMEPARLSASLKPKDRRRKGFRERVGVFLDGSLLERLELVAIQITGGQRLGPHEILILLDELVGNQTTYLVEDCFLLRSVCVFLQFEFIAFLGRDPPYYFINFVIFQSVENAV